MVYGLGIQTANLIIEIKNYRQEKKLAGGFWIPVKQEAETMLLSKIKEQKGVVKNGTERNPKDTRPQ